MSVIIMLFVGQSLEITGDSMYPTLKDKERIIVEKVTYKSREPRRGEIIVFRSLQNDRIFLIKLVIAVSGDLINLDDNGNVRVVTSNENKNETEVAKTFGQVESLGVLEQYSEIPIPQGYIAVMGDNRDESYDSRMFGLIPLENVVGKAFIVYWPLANVRKVTSL